MSCAHFLFYGVLNTVLQCKFMVIQHRLAGLWEHVSQNRSVTGAVSACANNKYLLLLLWAAPFRGGHSQPITCLRLTLSSASSSARMPAHEMSSFNRTHKSPELRTTTKNNMGWRYHCLKLSCCSTWQYFQTCYNPREIRMTIVDHVIQKLKIKKLVKKTQKKTKIKKIKTLKKRNVQIVHLLSITISSLCQNIWILFRWAILCNVETVHVAVGTRNNYHVYSEINKKLNQ